MVVGVEVCGRGKGWRCMGGVEVYGGRGGGVREGWRCVGEVRCVVGEVESMGGVEQCEE